MKKKALAEGRHFLLKKMQSEFSVFVASDAIMLEVFPNFGRFVGLGRLQLSQTGGSIYV